MSGATLPIIYRGERLLEELRKRGISVALTDAGNLWAMPKGSLRAQDIEALKLLKPVLIAILGSPHHTCPRCDIVRAGCAALGIPSRDIIQWFHPDRWKPFTGINIRPARSFGPRSAPMMERDESQRDPAMLPIVKAAIAAGATALAINPDEVLGMFFADLMEAAA